MILTAENLLRVLHIYKYLRPIPSPKVKPNETKKFSFSDIIYYISGGEHYDAVTFQELPNYYLVRSKHCYTSRWIDIMDE